MASVDLVYDVGCPHVEAARTNLLRAFSEADRPARWREYRIGSEDLPAYAQGYGSPTVLVEGRDIAGSEPGTDACCRLYSDGSTASGIPPVARIAAALRTAGAPTPPTGGGWRSTLAVAPGVAVALLPKVVCPACWPAYAGVLGALGLGFLMSTAWLLPLTAIFLATAVGALAFRARRRRGYGPFAVGLVAAAVVLSGKFVFDSDPAMYAGVALLVAGSIWNTWPVRTQAAVCPARAEPRQSAEAGHRRTA